MVIENDKCENALRSWGKIIVELNEILYSYGQIPLKFQVSLSLLLLAHLIQLRKEGKHIYCPPLTCQAFVLNSLCTL